MTQQLTKRLLLATLALSLQSLDIYKISGDTLTFGTGAKIVTSLAESDRPTTLNAQGAFTKKK